MLANTQEHVDSEFLRGMEEWIIPWSTCGREGSHFQLQPPWESTVRGGVSPPSNLAFHSCVRADLSRLFPVEWLRIGNEIVQTERFCWGPIQTFPFACCGSAGKLSLSKLRGSRLSALLASSGPRRAKEKCKG